LSFAFTLKNYPIVSFPPFYHKVTPSTTLEAGKTLSFLLFTFLFLLYNIRAGQFKETNGEGITRIIVVGDFVSAVLADSVTGAYFVAGGMALVDSVSYCRYCRGGVSCLH
jgi:hypothetical protein